MFEQLSLSLCVPSVGDEVFYVRRWNPIKGEVFDRFAILEKKITELRNGYYIAEDKEVLIPARTFSDIEQAKECILELQDFVEIAY